MKQKNNRLVYWLGIIIIGAFLGFSLQFVRAWTEPASAPPTGNVGAPINTSNVGQSKLGNLILNSNATWANGLIVAAGNVGIGTAAPTAKLHLLSTTGSPNLKIESTNTGPTGRRPEITFSQSGYDQWGIINEMSQFRIQDWTTAGGAWTMLSSNTGSKKLSLATNGGDVGIGTTSPGAKLEVAGQVKVTGGSPGAGKVLTSDADGLASWQAPSGGALPVGSVYLSVVSTNPNTLLGYGTWEQVAKGRALVGQDSADADWDTAEETRGEKTHLLTQAELPSHYHTVNPPNTNTGGHSADHSHYVSGNTGGISANHKHGPNDGSTGAVEFLSTKVSGTGNFQRPSSGNNAVNNPTTGYVSSDHGHWWGAQTGGASANHTHAVDIAQFNSGSLGSGTAFNNLQPSFVIYVWKRTG